MNFDLSPDQQHLQGRVREFAQREVAPIAEQLDRDGVFPTALFKKLGDLGVMSIPFAENLGGMGLGVFDAVLALEEVARADQSLAVSAMVSMATGLTVSRFGTQQQIDQWLPDIVTGQKMCAIAGTEPDAGSDTAGFKTRAKMVGNDRWSISGEKAYITNAGTDISIFTLLLTVSTRCFWCRMRPRATSAASGIASWAGARPTRARFISIAARSRPTTSSARRIGVAICCTRVIRRRDCFSPHVR
jgi:short/branched chain acyl-CoA dehydrogenase